MSADPDAEALLRDLIAAGLDPIGLDLATLAGIRTETERKVASHRGEDGFLMAEPAFNPPKEPQ